MITRHNAFGNIQCLLYKIDNHYYVVIHSININCLGKSYTRTFVRIHDVVPLILRRALSCMTPLIIYTMMHVQSIIYMCETC